MLLDDYYWHYDYARLAWDTGFCFDKYKYPNLDKNKICLIDIDRIVKERDVASVERNIPTVVQYVLENDQADVLDSNFVKLFRLSQLSVEYLLFCKKYLDKTVVLLKKEKAKLKQEIKDIKTYVEELETHISSSRNPSAIHTCTVCSKMFSSEDYLNSHLKRRHNLSDNKDTTTTSPNSEAEKLYSEIKELKERLNNTEKFIQEKPQSRDIDNFKEVHTETEGKTTKLVTEIQESFDNFRKQVEDKMTSLQSEKDFFTDKYDKLFDVVLQYKNKEQEPKNQEEEKKTTESPKIENISTQTDEVIKTIEASQTHIVHVDEEIAPTNRDMEEKIDKKLSCFEENIESKISTGLCNIENQIQAVWQKLSEGDLHKPEATLEIVKTIDEPVQTEFQYDHAQMNQDKPAIKPRTKFTKPSTLPNKNIPIERRDSIIKNEILTKPKQILQTEVVKSAVNDMYETSSDIDTESVHKLLDDEIIDIEKDKPSEIAYRTTPLKVQQKEKSELLTKKIDKKSAIDVMDLHMSKKNLKLTSNKQNTSDEIAINEIRKNVNNLIDSSLQEMGISPSWTGLPKKNFERALEIVKHQAVLNKKSLPEYDSYRKSIEKLLRNDKKLKEVTRKVQSTITGVSPSKRKLKPKTITIQIKKTDPEPQIVKSDPVVKINNRSLYDTESDTDLNVYLPKKLRQEKAHDAVIEELQSKFSQKSADTDSDLNSIILSYEEKDTKEKETKSALKTFSSEGSLIKKKVFFDVEEFESEDGKSGEDQKLNVPKEDSLSDFEIT